MKAILCRDQCNPSLKSVHNFGPFCITESCPTDLPYNCHNLLEPKTFQRLINHWKLIHFDHNLLIAGYVHEQYELHKDGITMVFPGDIIDLIRGHCMLNTHSYKMRCDTSNNILNFWNISSLYQCQWFDHRLKHRQLQYCFRLSTAIIFLVDLSSFNRIIKNPKQKRGGNAMMVTIDLFKTVLADYSLYLVRNKKKHNCRNSVVAERGGFVVLIFNHIEEFKAKLAQNMSITECEAFRNYDGPNNDYDRCEQYIKNYFQEMLLQLTTNIKLYFTSLHDAIKESDI